MESYVASIDCIATIVSPVGIVKMLEAPLRSVLSSCREQKLPAITAASDDIKVWYVLNGIYPLQGLETLIAEILSSGLKCSVVANRFTEVSPIVKEF